MIHNKTKVKYIDFLRPDCYWPWPYTIEQAFQVYRWMVQTGGEYYKYGYSTVYDLLSKKPTCSGHRPATPIVSLEDLRMRFHYALLSNHTTPLVEKWRKDYKISVVGERWIYFPYRARGDRTYSEAEIAKKLTKFLEAKGTLAVQLNESHPGAKEIYQTYIQAWGDRFKFSLKYGYEGSSWYHTLAETESNECFVETFIRAAECLKELKANTLTGILEE